MGHRAKTHGSTATAPLQGETQELISTLSAAHAGDFCTRKVPLFPSSGSATSHRSVSHEADVSHQFGGYASPFGAAVAFASHTASSLYSSPAAEEFATSSSQASLRDSQL